VRHKMSENMKPTAPEKKAPKKRTYKVTPQHKHVKICIDERIVVRNGTPYYEKWAFLPEDFPCGMCGKPDDIKFMRCPTGVYHACDWCGVSQKVEPQHPNTGEDLARLIERKPISVEDAWVVVERNRQTKFPPAGLSPLKRRRRKQRPLDEIIPEDVE